MGKIILVTGGARSGKSTYAEEMAKGFGENVLYVATSIPFDDEMKLRIKKHREQRPAHWETLEAYKDLDRHLQEKVAGKSAVLLDCVTIMVTNLMFEGLKDFDNIQTEEAVAVEAMILKEVNKLIDTVSKVETPFIVVTNELGMGIVPEYPSARLFRDIAGRVNQVIARSAQEVYLCVSGIPVKIK